MSLLFNHVSKLLAFSSSSSSTQQESTNYKSYIADETGKLAVVDMCVKPNTPRSYNKLLKLAKRQKLQADAAVRNAKVLFYHYNQQVNQMATNALQVPGSAVKKMQDLPGGRVASSGPVGTIR